jgi:hypothetical protein
MARLTNRLAMMRPYEVAGRILCGKGGRKAAEIRPALFLMACFHGVKCFLDTNFLRNEKAG